MAQYPMQPMMLKIELNGMKHAVLHAFNTHATEVAAAIEAEMTRQIETLDLAGIVEAQVEQVLGPLVREHIMHAVDDVLKDPEVKGRLDQIAMAAAAKFFANQREADSE